MKLISLRFWIRARGPSVPLDHDRVATFPVCPVNKEADHQLGPTLFIFVSLDSWLSLFGALCTCNLLFKPFLGIYWSDN